MPLAIRLPDIEIVAAIANRHTREQTRFPGPDDFQLSVSIFSIFAQIKLIVSFKIANHVLWRIGTEHPGHAGLGPSLVDAGVASTARFRPPVSRGRTNLGCGPRRSIVGHAHAGYSAIFRLPQKSFESDA